MLLHCPGPGGSICLALIYLVFVVPRVPCLRQLIYLLMSSQTFYHKLYLTLLNSKTILMNFTRKSNFSSIIVTKKIYDGEKCESEKVFHPIEFH